MTHLRVVDDAGDVVPESELARSWRATKAQIDALIASGELTGLFVYCMSEQGSETAHFGDVELAWRVFRASQDVLDSLSGLPDMPE